MIRMECYQVVRGSGLHISGVQSCVWWRNVMNAADVDEQMNGKTEEQKEDIIREFFDDSSIWFYERKILAKHNATLHEGNDGNLDQFYIEFQDERDATLFLLQWA